MAELSEYEIRKDKNDQVGIYLREYNVRLAVFAVNSFALQKRLSDLFNDARARKNKLKKAVVKKSKHRR
jgi:hypothetical protein